MLIPFAAAKPEVCVTIKTLLMTEFTLEESYGSDAARVN